jgi:predicted transcriptional regulator with HTH domain
MSWADAAAPIVAEVIRSVGRSDMKALRKALIEAYPWGERENTPYTAWLSEIRRQLGHPLNAPKADPSNKQTDMFNQR